MRCVDEGVGGIYAMRDWGKPKSRRKQNSHGKNDEEKAKIVCTLWMNDNICVSAFYLVQMTDFDSFENVYFGKTEKSVCSFGPRH